MPRCLILVTKTSYRTDAFLAAARRLEVDVVLGSDRCHQLAELWSEEAFARLAPGLVETSLSLDYRDPDAAADQIAAAAAARPLDAVVATDDQTAVIAALASRRLGLAGNAPEAAQAARDKWVMRRRLAEAAVPSPRALLCSIDDEPRARARSLGAALGFPVVAKPLLLSASRGVIRADDEAALARALERVAAILRTRAELADGIEAARRILVEAYVPGEEVAVEGLVAGGALTTLAIFDKPDPLVGPFFEETLYVTPSRHPEAVQAVISRVTAQAAAALGLREGPIHAELRLPGGDDWRVDPVVIEVAARSIGGLCARTLRFSLGGAPEAGPGGPGGPVDDGGDHALEELVLRCALGLPLTHERRAGGASGVMMLPVPGAGVLQEVAGVDEARAVPLVEDVVITARPGERLVPLPEGSSYPGFVFARAGAGEGPDEVEAALRAAFAKLSFVVSPTLPG